MDGSNDIRRAAVPPEWEAGLDALRALPAGAAAMVIGGTDRGKTSFVSLAAQTLAAELHPVWVVDADIGQSEIGAPGCVGVARADPQTPRLHHLKPTAQFFVGAFSPAGVALEHVAATGAGAAWARTRDPARILVDTTGFVEGPAARRLKVAKAALIRPQLVLGVGRGDEIDSLLRAVAAAGGGEALALPVPAQIGRKGQSLRATRRLTRTGQALTGSREIRLALADVATAGATLGTGRPQPPHLLRWLSTTLRRRVAHAEIAEGVLTLFLESAPPGDWEQQAFGVREHFQVEVIRALSLTDYESVYCGLLDGDGRLITVARFVRFDGDHHEMVLSAPPPAGPERVRLVRFGRVRVRGDGAPLGDIRAGEI